MKYERKEYILDNEVYLGDANEILPELLGVDAIITDPPYGINKPERATGFLKKRNIQREANKWDKRLTESTIRLLTSFPVWIIWGGNYYASLLGDCVAPLVWDKKTGKNYFADGELAFTSFKSGTLRIFHHQWCGFIKASEKGEALQYSTQKPVALMKWCIEQIKPRPKLICDPLMGSGTTGVACIEMGIKFIGIEKRENAFELALRRLFGAKKILGGFNKNLGLLDDIE